MHLWQAQIILFHSIFALNALKTKEIVWWAPCCSPTGIRCAQVYGKEGDVLSSLPSSCLGSEIIVTKTIVTHAASYCLCQAIGDLAVFACPSGETRGVAAGSPLIQPCGIGARWSREGGMKADSQAANTVIITPPGRVFSCTLALDFMLCQRMLLTGVCSGHTVLFNRPFNLILLYFCLQQGLLRAKQETGKSMPKGFIEVSENIHHISLWNWIMWDLRSKKWQTQRVELIADQDKSF